MIFPFDYKKKKRRRRRIIVSIIAALVLIVGFSIQEIYQRYFYEQDRLIHVFPNTTVVYAHATLSGAVYGDVQQFLQFHPVFTNYLVGHADTKQLLATWPQLPYQDAEQVSFGVRYEQEKYIPQVALLFSSAEEASVLANKGSLGGWDIYQDEDLIWLVPIGTDQWSDQTLHGYFLQEYLPVSNSWYIFLQKETGIPWLESHFGSEYALEFVEKIAKDKPYGILSLAFRDNSLIIFDSALALNQTEVSLGLEDVLESDVLYVAKNVLFEDLAMQYGLSKWSGISPDSSLRPGIATRFELEHERLSEVVQENYTSFVYEEGFDSSFVAFKVTSGDYEGVLSLLRSLASYDFPKKIQKRLDDGTIITEFLALDHDGIQDKVFNQGGFQVTQLQSGNVLWDYSLVNTNNDLFITNDHNKVITLNSQLSEIQDVCRVGDVYMYNKLDHSKKQEIGLNIIAVLSNSAGTYVCFR
ncbi:MAG: hypothetical protein ACPGO5_05100 [Patescibacteria group bacterium]